MVTAEERRSLAQIPRKHAKRKLGAGRLESVKRCQLEPHETLLPKLNLAIEMILTDPSHSRYPLDLATVIHRGY